MSRVRHDLGGSPTSSASSSKAAKADNPQKVKLIVAIVVLLVAGVLIAYQSGILDGAPPPLAAQPGAEADDNVNLDNPGEPPPKSNFRRGAQPIK